MSEHDQGLRMAGQGPYNMDVQGLIMSLLSQVLDPDVASLLSGLLGSMLPGSLAGSMLFSNQSNLGIFNNWSSSLARATGNALANEIATRVRQQTLGQAYRTLHPDASATAVSNFVNNIMSKFGFGTIYGMIDSAVGFDYSTDIGNYTGMMAANQAMNMLRSGRGPDAFWFADTLAKSLFPEGAYDPSQFGGMSQRGAAILAARIGEHMDLTRGFYDAGRADGVDEHAKAAAERLRKVISDYGRALQPLKDVFGDDIPAMIDTLEKLTGKALGATSAARLSDVSMRLANAVLAGNYTVEQLAATTGTVNNIMATSRPGLPLNYYTMSPALAGAILNMQMGNTAPSYMTDAQYSSMIMDTVTSRAQLKGGDDFVKAFILWRRRSGGYGTFEQFEDAMRRMGGVHIRNAMRLAGAMWRGGLDMAYSDPEYNRLVASGVGGEFARLQKAGNIETLLGNGLMRNRFVWRALGQGPAGVRRTAGMMFQALRNNGELLNTDSIADMVQMLSGMGYTQGDAVSVARMIAFARNDPKMNRYMAELQALNGERVSKAREWRMSRLRGTLAMVDSTIMDPSMGLSALLTDGGRWTQEGIAKWLNSSGLIARSAPEWRQYVSGAVSAGLLAADLISPDMPAVETTEYTEWRNAVDAGMAKINEEMLADKPDPSTSPELYEAWKKKYDDKVAQLREALGAPPERFSAEYTEWAKKRNEAARGFANYALSQKGLTNAVYQRTLRDFNDPRNAGRRGILARVLQAASTPGASEAVAEFLGDPRAPGYAGRQEELAKMVNDEGYERRVAALIAGKEDAPERAALEYFAREVEEKAGALDGNLKNEVTNEERLKAIDQLIEHWKTVKLDSADEPSREKNILMLESLKYAASASNTGLVEKLRVANYTRGVNDLIASQVGVDKAKYSELNQEIENRAIMIDDNFGDYVTAQDRVKTIRKMIEEEREGGGDEEKIRRLEEFEQRAVNAAKATATPFNLSEMLGKITLVLRDILAKIPGNDTDGDAQPTYYDPKNFPGWAPAY